MDGKLEAAFGIFPVKSLLSLFYFHLHFLGLGLIGFKSFMEQ